MTLLRVERYPTSLNTKLQVPTALRFGGSGYNTFTGAVVAPASATLNSLTTMTVEAWILSESNEWANNGQRVIDGVIQLFPYFATNAIQFQVNGGSGTVRNSVPQTLGAWTHVAGTYNGTTTTLYVNGALITTAAYTGNSGTPANFTIGNGTGANRAWVGSIQELRLSNNLRYSATFTPQQSVFTSDANTLLLYHMNEGTGTTCFDSGPNGLHAPFTGTVYPTWGPGLF